MSQVLRVAASSAALMLLGSRMLPRPGGSSLCPGWRACQLAVGLAVAVPVLSLLAAAGMPLTETSILVSLLLASAGVAFLERRAGRPPAREHALPELSAWHLLLLAALVLFAWKVLVVPLWSWDHHVIWGMKSRRMLSGGLLDLGFLREPPFGDTHPEYPVGLPLAWRLFALGAVPDETSVKAVHLLLAAALLAALNRVLIGAGLSRSAAACWASFAAVTPLFWDTESVGGADLPLSFMAVSGLALLLRTPPSPRVEIAAGLVIGALPWVKTEGIVLAALMLAVALFWKGRTDAARWRFPVALLGAAGLTAAVLAVFHARYLTRSPPFLAGDWWDRITQRLGDGGHLLGAMARTLIHPDWLGAWILFVAGLLAALARRRMTSAAVGAVVVVQSLFYAATYLATFLDPLDHVRASFHRIMAALLPIAIASTALALSGRRSAPTGAAGDSPPTV